MVPILAVIVVAVLGSLNYEIVLDKTSSPVWEKGSNLLTKQLYSELKSNRLTTDTFTYWDAMTRTDLVTYKGQVNDFRWIFSNAAAPVPVSIQGNLEKKLELLKEQFPLIVLPIMAGKPERFLTVGSVVGPEWKLASYLQVGSITGFLSNRSIDHVLAQRPDVYLDSGPDSHLDLKYVDVRNAMHKDKNLYDQIFMPIMNGGRSLWTGSSIGEGYMYTKEAFRGYWDHLNEGGMLAITTSNQILFSRVLLTAWEMLIEDSGGNAELTRQAWGFRLHPMAEFKGPHQYLLILVKGVVPDSIVNSMKKANQLMPITPLFGKGVKQTQPYAVLNENDIDKAREVLTVTFSRQARVLLDFKPLDDLRPFLFMQARDVHPYLKLLLACCLLILILSLLFAVPSQRHMSVARNDEYPSLSVMLLYFMLLGAGLFLVGSGVMQRIILLTGASYNVITAIFSALLSGFVVGVILFTYKKINICFERWFPIAVMIFIGGIHWLIVPIKGGGDGLQTLSVMILSLLTGLFAGMSFRFGLEMLKEKFIRLVPWALLVFGVSLLAGAVLSHWFAQLWGWSLVWAVAASCWFLVFIIGSWMRSTLWHKQGTAEVIGPRLQV